MSKYQDIQLLVSDIVPLNQSEHVVATHHLISINPNEHIVLARIKYGTSTDIIGLPCVLSWDRPTDTL